MTDKIIAYNPDWKFDFALHFKMARQLEGELKSESGYIKNSRGNFKAVFRSASKRNAALKSIDAGEWYDADGDGLGHSYYYENVKIWPPDFQLIPGDLYTVMIAGDKVGILHRGKSAENQEKYYESTFKFFQQYYGMNIPGTDNKYT